MQVTINDRCFKKFNAWLNQPYSPDLTNADKIKANLLHIGNISRIEWAESFDTLCDTLNLYDLTLVNEISVENLALNPDFSLTMYISVTMLNSDEERLYVSFPLDCTLNIIKCANNDIHTAPKTATVIKQTESIRFKYNTNDITSILSSSARKHTLPFFVELSSCSQAKKVVDNETLAEKAQSPQSPRSVIA